MVFGQVPVATSLTCATTGARSQLSVALTSAGLGAGTSPSHWTVKFVGQRSTGGSLSLTVTVTLNEQLAVPAMFEAVQVTVVAPAGKACGEVITVEPILHVTAGAGLPVAVGANASVRAHKLTMFGGQVMAGGVFVVAELIVTVKVHVVMLLAPSLAVQVTGVVPNGNVEPAGGVQLAVTPGQLSVAVGAEKLTTKVVWPGGASATMFVEQVIDGGCVSLTVTVKEHL